jgi:hypothetical protein
MKRLIIALVCLFASAGARAQLVAVTGNVKDAGGTNATGLNGDCYVDGVLYPRTSVGIAAALAACSPGTTHLTAGVYDRLLASINVACGQNLVFDGNPNISFSLTGTDPAIIYNAAQCGTFQNAVTGGSAAINMNHTGGTVFKVCAGGNQGGVFGPNGGTWIITNQTGNTIDFGPCALNYSVANFTVQNITSQTVPGDLIQVITNNYSSTQDLSPYIEAVTFSHIGALDLTGKAIRINANATGTEVNVNSLSFDHIFMTNNTSAASPPAPIFIQSSFTSTNSISFQVRDSVFGYPHATGRTTAVDSDGAINTNHSLLSIVLDGLDIQGGTNPTVGFSPTITTNAPSYSDLQYRGSNLPIAYHGAFITPTIGAGGSIINGVFRANALLLNTPFTSIAAQTCQEQTLTLTGASTTGVASASPSTGLGNANLNWSAWVSGANTVTVRVCNPSTGSIIPSSVTWAATVIQ